MLSSRVRVDSGRIRYFLPHSLSPARGRVNRQPRGDLIIPSGSCHPERALVDDRLGVDLDPESGQRSVAPAVEHQRLTLGIEPEL